MADIAYVPSARICFKLFQGNRMHTNPSTLTIVHTLLSIVSLLLGAAVVIALASAMPTKRPLQLFLATALATSFTGFLFPFNGITPAAARVRARRYDRFGA
jgi:hypothetical protein